MSLLVAVVEPSAVRRPTDHFPCRTLGCSALPAATCVARQRYGDVRTRDTWRGQAARYVQCVTERCPVGRAIRRRIEKLMVAPRTFGPPEFATLPPEQASAKARDRRAGLLADVPTLDSVRGPVGPLVEDDEVVPHASALPRESFVPGVVAL